MRQVPLPPAETVNLKLRELIAQPTNVPDQGKLDRALPDAAEEAEKPAPDKAGIGGAVERAVKYAKSATDFGDQVEKLLPRMAAMASWASAAGRGLLAMAGIAI